jgi:hypothetical protein
MIVIVWESDSVAVFVQTSRPTTSAYRYVFFNRIATFATDDGSSFSGPSVELERSLMLIWQTLSAEA